MIRKFLLELMNVRWSQCSESCIKYFIICLACHLQGFPFPGTLLRLKEDECLLEDLTFSEIKASAQWAWIGSRILFFLWGEICSGWKLNSVESVLRLLTLSLCYVKSSWKTRSLHWFKALHLWFKKTCLKLLKLPRVFFSVEIFRDPHVSLGISIVGGQTVIKRLKNGEELKGIFIKQVLEDSPAGRTRALKTGDKILEVNGDKPSFLV